MNCVVASIICLCSAHQTCNVSTRWLHELNKQTCFTSIKIIWANRIMISQTSTSSTYLVRLWSSSTLPAGLSLGTLGNDNHRQPHALTMFSPGWKKKTHQECLSLTCRDWSKLAWMPCKHQELTGSAIFRPRQDRRAWWQTSGLCFHWSDL